MPRVRICNLSPGCLHAEQFNLQLTWVTGGCFTLKNWEHLFLKLQLFLNGRRSLQSRHGTWCTSCLICSFEVCRRVPGLTFPHKNSHQGHLTNILLCKPSYLCLMSQSCLGGKFCGNRTFSPDAADISARSCIFILFGVWTFLLPITHSSCLHVHFKKKIQSMMVGLCCCLSCRLGIRGVGECSCSSRLPGEGCSERSAEWNDVNIRLSYNSVCSGLLCDAMKKWGRHQNWQIHGVGATTKGGTKLQTHISDSEADPWRPTDPVGFMSSLGVKHQSQNSQNSICFCHFHVFLVNLKTWLIMTFNLLVCKNQKTASILNYITLLAELGEPHLHTHTNIHTQILLITLL